MFKPILVPLDGSALGERALNYAGLIAGSAGAPLHLVRAVGAASLAHYSRAETLSLAVAQQSGDRVDAQASLARTASRLRRLGHAVQTYVRFGRPSDVILATSRELGVGLVVLATRGLRGLARWWEGSVADEVVRWADGPVLLVREWDNGLSPTDQPPRVLVALDGSSFAEAVLERASELAGVLKADLVVAHVVMPPSLLEEARGDARLDAELAFAQAYLDRVANTLCIPGHVTTRIRVGTTNAPAATLAQIAREERVDLVALATHGRGGLARMALGSTATAMLEESPVPLLVVRPAGLTLSRTGIAAQAEEPDAGALALTGASI